MHPPQLSGSELVSVQVPPQFTSGPGQPPVVELLPPVVPLLPPVVPIEPAEVVLPPDVVTEPVAPLVEATPVVAFPEVLFAEVPAVALATEPVAVPIVDPVVAPVAGPAEVVDVAVVEPVAPELLAPLVVPLPAAPWVAPVEWPPTAPPVPYSLPELHAAAARTLTNRTRRPIGIGFLIPGESSERVRTNSLSLPREAGNDNFASRPMNRTRKPAHCTAPAALTTTAEPLVVGLLADVDE
jgi:hypothetical protein